MVDYKKILGFLSVLILASGIVYIAMESVQVRVDEDKTTFYIKLLDENQEVYGRWLVSGREYNKLFDGSKLINRRAKDILINTIIDDKLNTTTITRATPYSNGALIIDTYFFNGQSSELELFPVSHEIEIYNGNTCGTRGCIFQYEVGDLEYDGLTRDAQSPEIFGKRMTVEWDDNAYYSKVFQQQESDKLLVKWRVLDNYMKIEARLFDPIFPDDNISTVQYNYTYENKTAYHIAWHMVNESYQSPVYINETDEVQCNPGNSTCYNPCLNVTLGQYCMNWTHSKFDHYDTDWHMVNESYKIPYQTPDNISTKISGTWICGEYYKSEFIGGMFFYNDTLSVMTIPPGDRNWLGYPECELIELEKDSCYMINFSGGCA